MTVSPLLALFTSSGFPGTQDELHDTVQWLSGQEIYDPGDLVAMCPVSQLSNIDVLTPDVFTFIDNLVGPITQLICVVSGSACRYHS